MDLGFYAKNIEIGNFTGGIELLGESLLLLQPGYEIFLNRDSIA